MDINFSSSRQRTCEVAQANEVIGQLPEILEKICSHLNIQTLGRAATVNGLWNDVAMRELSERGSKIMIMPISNAHDSVYDFFKPLVTVFFTNSRDLQNDKCKKDLLKCEKSFPNYLVVVPTRLLMLNEEEIFYSDCQSKSGIISLLFPQYRDLKIRMTCDKELFRRTCYINAEKLNEALLDELLPEDSTSKATFIIFGPPHHKYNRILLALEHVMEERQQEYVVWGGDFETPPFSLSDPSYGFHRQGRGLFAMTITGMSLESSSIVIGCEIEKHEFDRKLLDFRRQLRFKRRSIGLLCGPVHNPNQSNVHYSPKELTATVKRIFPNVPLIGTFDHIRCYGLKSKADDPNQLLEHLYSFSLMILTFD